MSQTRRSLHVTVNPELIEKIDSDIQLGKYVSKSQAVESMIRYYYENHDSSEIEDIRAELRIVKESLKELEDLVRGIIKIKE